MRGGDGCQRVRKWNGVERFVLRKNDEATHLHFFTFSCVGRSQLAYMSCIPTHKTSAQSEKHLCNLRRPTFWPRGKIIKQASSAFFLYEINPKKKFPSSKAWVLSVAAGAKENGGKIKKERKKNVRQ